MYERFTRATHRSGQVAGSSIKKTIIVTSSKTQSMVLAYAQNPMPHPVIATLARLHIRKPSNVACNVDLGVGPDKTGSYENLIDTVGVNMPINTVYDNILDQGNQGTSRQYVGVGQFFVCAVSDGGGNGDANGLIADVFWDFRPLTGGTDGIAEQGAG